MQRNPVTPEGYEALVADLRRHKSVLRPQVVRDIEEARAHGDISENSEYEDAKDRQGHIEGRIAELENLVATAEVIDPTKIGDLDRIVFGATVLIENEDGEERTYQIVGETESDVNAGKISYKSPLARALIGKSEGDDAEFPAPGGQQTWSIVEVRYN